MKVPNASARTELQSGSRTKTLPPASAEAVAGLLAGETLEQVATLVTTRTTYRLRNATGELVLEIADDQVESGPGESTLKSWREVEVALGPAGMKKDLIRADKLLLAAGATPHAAIASLEDNTAAQRRRRRRGQDCGQEVNEAKRKANKRLRKADDNVEHLHRARKAFKRARYAAELVEPANAEMKQIAQDAKELQTLLGEHQDSVVAAEFLARMSPADNVATGESVFTYGIMMANELHRATAIRASLRS